MSQLSLEAQRAEYAAQPLLAMPIAGALCWSLVGIAGAVLPLHWAAWALFILTGSIFYVGMLIARFTGEDLIGRNRPRNAFDGAFFSGLAMSLLVFAIAIPYALVDLTSVPLSFGILSGLMWLPLGWIIQHWIGAFHAISRTVLVLAVWFLWPDLRFVVVPAVIVGIYAVTIWVLWRRPRQVTTHPDAPAWSQA